MNSMSIRQILGTACTILLANFISTTAYSQEKGSLEIDSLKAKVTGQVKRELSGV
ncbi:hypothetical protein [Niastella populi]|uniref:hypothetical protein n=1 Tax=Niastella populi TaxID=550983 RepID=UPI0013FDFB42|nr:hypothetical protein [Niastella populi]